MKEYIIYTYNLNSSAPQGAFCWIGTPVQQRKSI